MATTQAQDRENLKEERKTLSAKIEELGQQLKTSERLSQSLQSAKDTLAEKLKK